MDDVDNTNIIISMLMATRDHFDKLYQVFDSIESTAADPAKIVLSVYVDDDDYGTIAFLEQFGQTSAYRYSISWHIAPRTGSMGKMIEELYRASTPSQIYMPMPDDYVFATPDWDEKLREVWRQNPDGIWLAYPHDAISPGNVTFPIIGFRWLEITGRLLTSYFPFWFDDVWLDQVAQMIGRKIAVPFQITSLEGKGKSPRMFNLWFWHQFFGNTLDERIDEADRLRRSIYRDDPDVYCSSLALVEELAEGFDQLNRRFSRSELLQSEYVMSSRYSQDRMSSNILYISKEADAVLHLCDKLKSCSGSDHKTVRSLVGNIASTSLPIRCLDELKNLMQKSETSDWNADLDRIIDGIRDDLHSIKNRASEGNLPADFKLIMPEFTCRIVLKSWYRTCVSFLAAIGRKQPFGAALS